MKCLENPWAGLFLALSVCWGCQSDVPVAQASSTDSQETRQAPSPTENRGKEQPTALPKIPANLPLVTIHPEKGAPFQVQVELALTNPQRAKGLMYRKSMDANHGMLFVMDRIANHSFWMKNTYISLDMLFISPEGEVVGIVERTEPKTLTGRGVGLPSKYVLELNGGACASRGIKAGAWVDLSKARIP